MVEKTVLEMIAPSIEEAIEQGLEQLGLPREAVEIEVLDAGSRGIFGIGNRQARIRLREAFWPHQDGSAPIDC